MKTVSECKSLRYNLMVTPHLSLSKLADIAVERKKREIFYSFKPMAGGFYSSVIGLFDSFRFSFFDLIYSSLLGLFHCQFVLNLAKFFYYSFVCFFQWISRDKSFGSIEPFRKGNWQIYCGWWRQILPASIVDGSSCDSDGVLAANYGYFKKQHQILWNGNLFDSIIINRTI